MRRSHFTSIVARGGNLLLLVNLNADGAIPKVQEDRMLSIGKWLETNGEAIYATRIIAPFSTEDVDYTQSKDGKTVYAIVKNPKDRISVSGQFSDKVRVSLVGAAAELPFEKRADGLLVRVPDGFAKSPLPFVIAVTGTSGS